MKRPMISDRQRFKEYVKNCNWNSALSCVNIESRNIPTDIQREAISYHYRISKSENLISYLRWLSKGRHKDEFTDDDI